MSSHRNPGRQWSTSEDERLIAAVKTHGEDTESWKTIATAVTGRTNKACRKRWKHSLHPDLKKTSWEIDEDELLLKLYNEYPGRWALIATKILGRTDDACAKRYREALDPNLKKDDWTAAEDDQLLAAFARHGTSWGKVSDELGRSGLACRNRWRLLERRKVSCEKRSAAACGIARPRKKRRVKTPGNDGDVSDSVDQDDPKAAVPSCSQSKESATEALASASESDQPRPMDWIPKPAAADLPTSQFIDSSIIDMALGKCGCGCATGARPCNCNSTTPSLNLAGNGEDLFASIDWNQIFPYLKAELPSVFVDPPTLPMSTEFSVEPILPPAAQIQSALDKLMKPEAACSCTTRGSLCCSKPSSVAIATSCCGSRTPDPYPPNPEGTSAEAAKLVLDYASTMTQGRRSHQPTSSSRVLLLDGESLAPPSVMQQAALCQTPASQMLISIIERYQQQRSHPTSNAGSGILGSIPLPGLGGGCGCGCASQPSNADGQDTIRQLQGLASAVNMELLKETHRIQASRQSEVQPIGGSCSPKTEKRQLDVGLQTSPDFIGLPLLPSFIAGCSCGCADGAASGTCGCGCVGVCRCGSQSGSIQPSLPQVPGNAVDTYPSISKSTFQLSLAPVLQRPESCCSSHLQVPREITPGATEPQQHLGLFISSAADDISAISLPRFIPGCGCGCVPGTVEGTCGCGCVGVCLCASQGVDLEDEATAAASVLSAMSVCRLPGTPSTSSSTGCCSAKATIQTETLSKSCCRPEVGIIEPLQAHHSPGRSHKSKGSFRPPSPSSRDSSTQAPAFTTRKLSAQLPATLPAYACGHPRCWTPFVDAVGVTDPSLHPSARFSYSTSGELMDHRRMMHETDVEETEQGTGPDGSWLFRCAFTGCEKGWKSINGIQYHLQTSKTHPSLIFEAKDSPSASPHRQKAKPTKEHKAEGTQGYKPFPCPYPGCSSSYKQMVGLKYHMNHAHLPSSPSV